jgi:hypothetical protein
VDRPRTPDEIYEKLKKFRVISRQAGSVPNDGDSKIEWLSRLPDNCGLCANCIHARSVTSDRGSVFLLCELSFSDARFQKYPKLPVRFCPGYQKKSVERLKLDWTTEELAEGLRCYRSAQFFEAHEHWESVWLKAPEPEKTFLQGLIQMTAAFHHFQRGNLQGTASLLKQSLRKLEGFADASIQISVASLCRDIAEWLKALDASDSKPADFPEIRFETEEQP